MFLNKIILTNFRNYEKIELNFNNYVNIFIGNNAQGKTNILESIYFLSLTKSHRCLKDLNLIKNDCIFSKIKADILKDNIKSTYEILLNKEGKRVSINNKIIKKISDYVSNINTIMFCPDDLEIIKGSPSRRRSFLNIEIGQFDNKYLKVLNEYNKILKNRNEMLKSTKFDQTYFDILTDKLIEKNIEIFNFRNNFIKELNKYLPVIYKKITKNENIKISYDSFITNKDNIDSIRKKYKSIYENEKFQKTTLIGIHRDDFSIFIDGKKINDFGSQGQHRIAVLCLKLSEIQIYKKMNKKPIILLDDIFSELDQNKKNNIVKHFDKDMQIFITTTDLSNMNKDLKKIASIFKVKEGKITRGE